MELSPSLEISSPENHSHSYYSLHERIVVERFPPTSKPANFWNKTSDITQKSPIYCASLFYFEYRYRYDNYHHLHIISFSLFCNNNSQSNGKQQIIRNVKFELKLLNANEEVLLAICNEGSPDSKDEIQLAGPLPTAIFENRHFPENKLIVQVKLLKLNGELPFRLAFNMLSFPEKILQMHSTTLGSVFKSGKYSDFTIVVMGREFKTHKLMLAIQSPVFAAMLEHSSTKEVLESRLEITDIDEDVFEQLLEFIYTGRVNDYYVAYLFIAANKYQMDSLQTYCDNFMRFNLSDDNVADVYMLAHRFSATELRERCIWYMIDNCPPVSKAKLRPFDWWRKMDRAQLEDKLLVTFAKLRDKNNKKPKLADTRDDNSSKNNINTTNH